MNQIIQHFHFIYPQWLWLLIPVLLVLFVLLKAKNREGGLHKFIDPKLAPFVLVGEAAGKSRKLLATASIFYTIAVLAMAGPSWQKVKHAAYKKETALVIALDLSASMYAKDVQPNRLVRARFEIIDLLKQRKEGLTGLVVYAGDAFVVSPLTDDAETIIAQAKFIDPSIMPVQGSQAAIAIEKAMQLLHQANAKDGQILLVTDEINDVEATTQAAQQAKQQGVQVSVLAIGTEAGSPIPLPQGGFIKDQQGTIVLAKTNPKQMQTVAQAGGGLYVESDIGDQDLNRLMRQFSSENPDNLVKNNKKEIEAWINEGAYLVLLLLPLALLAFRKGYIVGILLVPLLLSQPKPTMAFSWNDLWLTPDQQAQKAMEKGDVKQAEKMFVDPTWKASAAYKAGDYEQALQGFSQQKSVDALYNQGNALAKMHKLPEAIKAYEAVLKQDKNHQDAKYNLDLLKKLLEKQQQQNQQNQQQSNNQQQNSDQKQSKQQQNQQQGQGKDADQKKPSEKDGKKGEDQALADKQKAQEEKEKKAAEDWKKQQEEAEKNKKDKNKDNALKDSKEPNEQQRELQQATEQWLRCIPDDPSGLWRRKFQYQYRQRGQPRAVGKPY